MIKLLALRQYWGMGEGTLFGECIYLCVGGEDNGVASVAHQAYYLSLAPSVNSVLVSHTGLQPTPKELKF